MRSRFLEMFSTGFVPHSAPEAPSSEKTVEPKVLYKEREIGLGSRSTRSITRTNTKPVHRWTTPMPTTAELVAPPTQASDTLSAADNLSTEVSTQAPCTTDYMPTSATFESSSRSGLETTFSQSNLSAESITISEDTITATDLRVRRSEKIICIAGMLLRTIVAEIKMHGLLLDYVGYPYRSRYKDSAWDVADSRDGLLRMGTHQELFEDAIILLWRDLKRRGFVVHELSYREERIKFPTRVRGRQVRKGIGLAWDLE